MCGEIRCAAFRFSPCSTPEYNSELFRLKKYFWFRVGCDAFWIYHRQQQHMDERHLPPATHKFHVSPSSCSVRHIVVWPAYCTQCTYTAAGREELRACTRTCAEPDSSLIHKFTNRAEKACPHWILNPSMSQECWRACLPHQGGGGRSSDLYPGTTRHTLDSAIVKTAAAAAVAHEQKNATPKKKCQEGDMIRSRRGVQWLRLSFSYDTISF